MGKLRSDSVTCRQIVRAFLDFLNSVEFPPETDSEAVDVVRDCLVDAFKINSSGTDEMIQQDLLLDLFMSRKDGEERDSRSNLCSSSTQSESKTTLIPAEAEGFRSMDPPNSEDLAGESDGPGGNSRDELFGRFYAALDKINFFTSSPGGVEDPDKVAKATQFFGEALTEMENSEGHFVNFSNLAEILKSKGNEAMRLKRYSEAIELYTCAIAIHENAVYYCNRAAAYTEIYKYGEAIEDCFKSINIDPNYSKAYSRLGSAYFAQGNYRDALDKGYLKALQLDPNNHTIQDNIQAAELKLLEQQHRAETDQNRTSRRGQESSTPAAGPANNSFQFSMGAFPEIFANVFRNMVPNQSQTSASQSSGAANSSASFTPFPINTSIPANFANILVNMASATQSHPDHQMSMEQGEPTVQNGANISVELGEVPEQVSDVLRSVMGMFSSQLTSQGGVPQGTDQTNERQL